MKPADRYIVFPMRLEPIGTQASTATERDVREVCEEIDREILSKHREAHPVIVVLRARTSAIPSAREEELSHAEDCVEMWYSGRRFVREDRRP